MSDPESAIAHFRRVERLATGLSDRGIAIYEHEYFLLAFGSFRLEVGTRGRRWGFSWDGKDGCLDVSAPYAAPEGRPAPPVAGRAERLGLGDLDAPFRFVRDFEFTA